MYMYMSVCVCMYMSVCVHACVCSAVWGLASDCRVAPPRLVEEKLRTAPVAAFPIWTTPGKSANVPERLLEATCSPKYVTWVWPVPEAGARGLTGATLAGWRG